MTSTFITYPHTARHFAEQLDTELRTRSIESWSTMKIRPGDKILDAVTAAMLRADYVIVLWNADAARSANIGFELGFASKTKKLIVVKLDDSPILLDTVASNIVSSPTNSMSEVATLIAASIPGKSEHKHPLAVEAPKNRGFAFLSYAEEDYVFVQELATFLRDEGFLFWEYSSGERDVEKLLYLELEARINDSAIVLSVVSPDWKVATWPAREFFYSKEVGRPVFLVECREVGPTLAIAGEHRIRCWGDHRKQGFELLSRELKRRGL